LKIAKPVTAVVKKNRHDKITSASVNKGMVMQVKFDWHMFLLGAFTLCVLIALAVG